MTLLWDDEGAEGRPGHMLERPDLEPTVRLRPLAVAPGARPIVVVVPGRRRRPGELGYARLARNPHRLIRRPPRGLRWLIARIVTRYWLWWALGVVGVSCAIAVVAALYALAVVLL